MIQDLGKRHFDNQFYNQQPCEEDYIISVRKNQILVGGEQNAILYPKYGDLTEENLLVSMPQENGFRMRPRIFTYLFAIDDARYFLTRDLELDGYRYEEMQYMRKGSPKENIYAGLVALQLGRWYASRRFCGQCGTPMRHDEVERMMRCPECGLMEFPKICPCVITAVINNGKILVSQYRGRKMDHYALIAGFAEVGETIEQCVEREVFEETHVHVKNLHYYKSQPWPFSESLLFGFFCELDGSEEITIQEDELSMAKWVTPEEIFEGWTDYALTNEMISKFKHDYQKYGKLVWDKEKIEEFKTQD